MVTCNTLRDMLAGRFCRTSINTVRSFTSVAVPRSSFLPPVRTCISRTSTSPLRSTFTNRYSFATMAVNTPYVTLNDGNKMPQVGFGLWKVDNDTCADTVYNAIKTGYRLFDGACGT
jgi:D-xylose reductase